MANGVVCPYCKSNLERDVQLEERVTCSECNKSFKVREHMIDAFNKKANPSLGKRMGLGTLKIVGGIIGFFIVLFLAVNLLMWQNSTSSKPSPSSANVQSPAQQKPTAEEYKQHLANSLAADKIAEYEIAKGNGDKLKACVLAGIINQAFLTANDQEHYHIWRGVQKTRCEEAGVPIKE